MLLACCTLRKRPFDLDLEFELGALERALEDARKTSLSSASSSAADVTAGLDIAATLDAARAERDRYGELLLQVKRSKETLAEAKQRRADAGARLAAVQDQSKQLQKAIGQLSDMVGVGGLFGFMNLFKSEDGRVNETILEVSALRKRRSS